MSTSIIFPLPDGATYIIPAVDDENWGQNVTNFLLAIPNGVLPRNGNFAFTGDVSITGGFGFVLPYLRSSTVNPASTGFLRLAKTDIVSWRNNANSADLPLGVNGLDQLTYNGTVIGAAGSVLSITGTAHQVIVSAPTGNVTLSLPQSIDTTSNPTFGTVTANLTGNVTGNVIGTASGNLPSTGGTLSGALDMGSNKITNLANGTNPGDAVNFGQISSTVGFQSGDLKAAAYTTVPAGWLLCDGTSYPTATYPTLFAAIGYTFGGAGANFSVPNMVNVVPIGAGSIAAMGVTAGTQTHSITTAEMPSHNHSITDPGHFHSIATNGGVGTKSFANADGTGAGQNTGTAMTGITINNNGSGVAISLVQPSLGVTWFIKI